MPVIKGIWIQPVINFIFPLNQLCNSIMDKNLILRRSSKFFSRVRLNNFIQASAVKKDFY